MLRIERMEVIGFKSFPERTVVDFPDGVTAVVGPNGSGKSNIVDAISWVLGEQSARALRGGRMEDVIFAGTEGRGPGGMAEVTLQLSAREDILPGSRTKVTLTRRLYRTGDSEYLMDGRPTRLADIRGLLEQVRAGERTYAIVDQGRVGSFVTSKPRERRQFIEDAAGISSYRQRRRLAEMKLEATKANLLRVDDILREVERQRRSLQRQASLARRARRLDEELRGLKTLWYGRRSVGLERRTEELSEFAAVAQREGEHLEAERSRQARVVAEVRARLEAAHAARTAVVDEAHRGSSTRSGWRPRSRPRGRAPGRSRRRPAGRRTRAGGWRSTAPRASPSATRWRATSRGSTGGWPRWRARSPWPKRAPKRRARSTARWPTRRPASSAGSTRACTSAPRSWPACRRRARP